MNTKSSLHCDMQVTRISKNDSLRVNALGVVFWNQGNTEVIIDNNFRLAAAKINVATGLLEGGKAVVWEEILPAA